MNCLDMDNFGILDESADSSVSAGELVGGPREFRVTVSGPAVAAAAAVLGGEVRERALVLTRWAVDDMAASAGVKAELQRAATSCNELQRAATSCNELLSRGQLLRPARLISVPPRQTRLVMVGGEAYRSQPVEVPPLSPCGVDG
jgi:hypothetical protein